MNFPWLYFSYINLKYFSPFHTCLAIFSLWKYVKFSNITQPCHSENSFRVFNFFFKEYLRLKYFILNGGWRILHNSLLHVTMEWWHNYGFMDFRNFPMGRLFCNWHEKISTWLDWDHQNIRLTQLTSMHVIGQKYSNPLTIRVRILKKFSNWMS